MIRPASKQHTLLDGRQIHLADLTSRERAFVADIEKMIRHDISYFEIYRAAVGPGSIALGGRNRIDGRIAGAPVYLIAVDLATRAGIAQGLILAPEHQRARVAAPVDGSMMSVAQAADLIGVSRAAVYKAIDTGAVRVQRIGNVAVVDRKSVDAYRARRAARKRESRKREPRRTAAAE